MIRFSSVAANADVIGDDTPMAEPQGGTGERQQRGPAGRSRRERGLRREPDGAPESGAAKPGLDINAPGFLKDEDAAKPG